MSAIQTAVRIKPAVKGETATTNMQALPDAKRILLGAKAFDCDFVMTGPTTQTAVFEQACLPIIDSVIDGNQGTILVYGQTGTGKTHTMFSSAENSPDGIVYQSIQRMLDASHEKNGILILSALEVYLEKVTDLQSSREVAVRKEFRPDLEWTPIKSIAEAEARINEALRSRHTTSTNMNERSSRGHVIINIKMLTPKAGRVSRASGPVEDDAPIEESQLTLVDLAGSENVNRSKVQGRAMLEASSINRSLLALKKIILELSSSSAPSHVSYRDSKLTLLLQDSIGGYSKTLLIACISAAGKDIEETRSTLEYTTKARQIRNLVHSEKERLLAKVKALEFDNQRYRNKFESFLNEKGSVTLSKAEYEELSGAKSENQVLKEELTDLRKRVNANVNAEIYLSVIRDMSKEREKAHAAEIQKMCDAHAKLSEGIETLAQSHYTDAMQTVADATRQANETPQSGHGRPSEEANALIQRGSHAIHEKYRTLVAFNSTALVSTARECDMHAKLAKKSVEAIQSDTTVKETLTAVTATLRQTMGLLEGITSKVSSEDHAELSQIVRSLTESSAANLQRARDMETTLPDNVPFLNGIFRDFEKQIKAEAEAHCADKTINLRPIENALHSFVANVRGLIVDQTAQDVALSQPLSQKNSSGAMKESLKRCSVDSQSSADGGAAGKELRASMSLQAKRRRPSKSDTFKGN